jgi:hypothetical protein
MDVYLGTAGCWFRGVPERYVAGDDTRGRQEERSYPWSQQVIHEISGLRFTLRLSIGYCFLHTIVIDEEIRSKYRRLNNIS